LEAEGRIRDAARDEELRLKGYQVVRFMNKDLLQSLGTFTERLSELCQAPPL
jgi:very-short-patch-repair endonuclease